MQMDVTNKAMEKLATKVAEALYEGDWESELVTREIATAESKAEALQRLKILRQEVSRAIDIVKES